MCQRAPRGHERFQSATSPLGQGPDANRKKNPAASLSFERALARQSRSLFPSHREHQLPINGFILRDAASRNDRPLLSRLFQMLLIDLPLFLASTCSISSFYLVAQRELRPKSWQRTFLYLPFVMATGIGIS